MTSVSTSGIANVDAWMVTKLFGSSPQDTSTTAARQSIAAIAVSSKNRLSTSTAQAVLGLASVKATSGTDAATPTTSNGVDKFFTHGADKSITQSNQILAKNASMTSEQVSSAFYGDGLDVAGYEVDSPKITFSDLISQQKIYISDQMQQASDTSLSDDERASAQSIADSMKSYVDAMQNSYDNKTLKIQKADDISGLDFKQSDWYNGDDPDKAATSAGGTMTYNQDFYTNRPNKDRSMMIDTGQGISLYVSW